MFAGSGFVSHDIYLYGYFSASIKLLQDYTVAVVAFHKSIHNRRANHTYIGHQQPPRNPPIVVFHEWIPHIGRYQPILGAKEKRNLAMGYGTARQHGKERAEAKEQRVELCSQLLLLFLYSTE